MDLKHILDFIFLKGHLNNWTHYDIQNFDPGSTYMEMICVFLLIYFTPWFNI